MRVYIPYLLVLMLAVSLFNGCSGKSDDINDSGKSNHQEPSKSNSHNEHAHEDHEEGGLGTVHLSTSKFNSLGIKVDSMPTRSISDVVDINGRLAVFPQHQAVVTAILGANITSIKVIEGEKVKKGQVLAYLSHPNLTNLQTAYIRAYSQMQYLRKEFDRQKRLYDEGVGAGKTYQQTKADYQAIKGEVKGFEAQLKQLSMNVEKIKDGNIYVDVPVVSPIDGNIEKVLVQIGQFVDAQAEILGIINIDHVHADLMIFEKDVYKIREGQKVSFTVESVPGKNLTATISAVGKNFEQNPRIVHVHAEIDQKEPLLIPGMYINGRIYTESSLVKALPEEAIIGEEGKTYIFKAEVHREDGKMEWEFTPVEIRTGASDEGWVEINLLEPLPNDTQVAWNKAYYLIAEMKKSETSHEH
ncbi:efflux RND transporter periplasmic adaptor subunit [Nitrosomonas mobilis]|uniref:Efflux transporter, RND family, MFP subunit n=1 Tax=Nitrosomonas mobilis TaxID=51642 RepID=A0A1G5SCG3_9PROT|nr:efflux RND transporter periplasmic adaptor subunit [Nitrosomonas mobilis]SCZ84510.1 Efflux transporter, RND family, MFP subunit [Nitrosomonas mobilis]